VILPAYEQLHDALSAAVTWGTIADIAHRRGDYDEALRIHREVTLPAYDQLSEGRLTALTWRKIADIAYERGEFDEALRIHLDVEVPAYEQLGDTRSLARTWGKIADIAERDGAYDEALRIRRDIELPAYEQVGDTRSLAVAWGQIAAIAFRQGDYDLAAGSWQKQLEGSQDLGDPDGTAEALWGLAQSDLAREDHDAALARLTESFRILSRLQRLDGITDVGYALGQLLMATGHIESARRVLGEALAAATTIGLTQAVQSIGDLLDNAPVADDAKAEGVT
jgi:tetratricopeptide (TPR) repeat protein